jgi:hypothetical protein
VVAVVLAAAALPTVAMDVYNAQDITDSAQGPGFQWTLVLSRDEAEALDYLLDRALTSEMTSSRWLASVRLGA